MSPIHKASGRVPRRASRAPARGENEATVRLHRMGPLEAVLFDFDGTLVDTEPLHFRAFREVFRKQGIPLTWEDYLRRFIGLDDRDAFRLAFRERGGLLRDEEAALISGKGRAFSASIFQGAPALYPGVLEWLTALKGRVPVALCSGAYARDILPILRSLGLSRAFDVRVTADDVQRSKPHPESYRLALSRLRARFAGRPFRSACCL
ncbi:MAG: HAD family phosphatase, partial [Kiritimatiellia bacterium]|nr:HAD family phosphatase [Kiritimatiellia bacterium]